MNNDYSMEEKVRNAESIYRMGIVAIVIGIAILGYMLVSTIRW